MPQPNTRAFAQELRFPRAFHIPPPHPPSGMPFRSPCAVRRPHPPPSAEVASLRAATSESSKSANRPPSNNPLIWKALSCQPGTQNLVAIAATLTRGSYMYLLATRPPKSCPAQETRFGRQVEKSVPQSRVSQSSAHPPRDSRRPGFSANGSGSERNTSFSPGAFHMWVTGLRSDAPYLRKHEDITHVATCDHELRNDRFECQCILA